MSEQRLTPQQALLKAIDNELNKKPYIMLSPLADSDDNTDNPAFPIIDFLNENIKEAEDKKDYWEENYQRPMSLHFRTMAVHRIAAFKEVLEFIEEEYKTDENGK